MLITGFIFAGSNSEKNSPNSFINRTSEGRKVTGAHKVDCRTITAMTASIKMETKR